MAGQATAIPLCRLHASEARRPEAGSRAVGVSDGSPKGARLAQRGSMRSTRARPGHAFPAGGTYMQKRRCSVDLLHRTMNRHGFGIADPAQPVRRALQGCQAQRGGDSPQGFPLECKRERAAPKARRHLQQAQIGIGGSP